MLDAPVNVLIDIAMHLNGALMAAPLGSALKETVLLDTALLGSLVQPDSEIRPDVAAHLLAALLGKTLHPGWMSEDFQCWSIPYLWIRI